MQMFPDVIIYLLAAISMLIVPFSWIIAWIAAVGVHELGHYIALKLCGIKVYRLRLSLSGLQMDTASMTNMQELLCSIAGPVSGLSLLLFTKCCPRVSVCAVIQTIYNMLPVYPLDGGRCIRCLLQMICKKKKYVRFEVWVQCGICFVVCALAIFGLFRWNLGLLPVILAAGLIFKSGIIKTPCKAAEQIVQ